MALKCVMNYMEIRNDHVAKHRGMSSFMTHSEMWHSAGILSFKSKLYIVRKFNNHHHGNRVFPPIIVTLGGH